MPQLFRRCFFIKKSPILSQKASGFEKKKSLFGVRSVIL